MLYHNPDANTPIIIFFSKESAKIAIIGDISIPKPAVGIILRIAFRKGSVILDIHL